MQLWKAFLPTSHTQDDQSPRDPFLFRPESERVAHKLIKVACVQAEVFLLVFLENILRSTLFFVLIYF